MLRDNEDVKKVKKYLIKNQNEAIKAIRDLYSLKDSKDNKDNKDNKDDCVNRRNDNERDIETFRANEQDHEYGHQNNEFYDNYENVDKNTHKLDEKSQLIKINTQTDNKDVFENTLVQSAHIQFLNSSFQYQIKEY